MLIPLSFYSFRFLMLCLGLQMFFTSCSNAQTTGKEIANNSVSQFEEELGVVLGVERTELYFPILRDKRVALVANHSSMINQVHLVDTLLSAGIDVHKVFTPEHGFRGEADAGKSISDELDPKTGLPIISLYGNNKKPSQEQLADVDILLFDIQDVGVRFYTYISTLHYVMEAAAEKGIPILVLDRPNPNGFYVDGPVLEKEHQSFVGMHPVPVVHGMSIAEYAKMINGEAWLKDGLKCDLMLVEMKNYDHSTKYKLPIKPSPNLPNLNSVYLYPSLCFFEGTVISVGRGTQFPFQQIGHPSLREFPHFFIPKSMPGASEPKLEGKKCHGYFFNADSVEAWLDHTKLRLDLLMDFYQAYGKKNDFFNSYFNLLAGNSSLKKAILQGASLQEIRSSWQEDLREFKSIRKKYLLYPDFE